MRTNTRTRWIGLVAGFGLLAQVTVAQGDEPQGESGRDRQDPPRIDEIDPMLGGANPQDELTQLFLEVESRMDKIGGLLLDASAGDTSRLAEVGESGLDELIDSAPPQPSGAGGGGIAKLLRSSRNEGDQVLTGIDRILEIAQSQGGSCSNPGSGEPKSSSSPQQQGQQESGKKKEEGQEKPDQGQKPNDGEEPKGNKDGGDPAANRQASKTPPSDVQDPVATSDDLERWGDLPVHLRDIFRAEGGADMPAQYRDWIDSYYRRLNDRSNDR